MCTQCSDRKYSFSSVPFRTARSKATDEDAGEAAYRRSKAYSFSYRRPATGIGWRPAFPDLPATGDRRPANSTGELITDSKTQQIEPATPAKRRTGEVTASNTPTNWRFDNVTTQQHNRLVYRRPATGRVAVSGSTQRPATGDRRPATGESPYQIPTFNTTDWWRPATGVPATYQIPTFNTTTGRRPASRRIRFQRSTQQIGVPATGDRRPASRRIRFQRSTQQIGVPATGDRRPASRRIRFQRSTQQIGTPTNWRTDVSTPNVTTQQISAPANWRTGDRRLLN